MSARKHSPEQIAAWAKDWGIPGYDHLDPVKREAHRQEAIKRANNPNYRPPRSKFRKQNRRRNK
jgi:hypothetical protein